MKVLVFYPGPVSFRQAQVAAHRDVLRALDIELVLADDFVTSSDGEYFSDVIELPPPAAVGEALRRVRAWLATNRAHAVVAQSEAGLCLGSLVARELGVPCASPEAAFLTTHKYRSRVELERAGVSQPRFLLAHDAAGVRAFAATVGYPVVLKGVASALGRLVTLVRDEREVPDCVARVKVGLSSSVDIARLVDFAAVSGLDCQCDPLSEFLVESFASGVPVETDGVVAGTEIRNFGVTEQVLSKPPLFFMEGYLLPADRLASEVAAIEETSNSALRALGVTNTGYSIEMRLHGGVASIIEVNGRLGWDAGFGDMFALVTGAQPAFQALEIALGAARPFTRRSDFRAALAYATCYSDSLVASVPSAHEIAALEREFGVTIGLAVHAGDRMHAPPDPEATPHLAFALASGARSSTDSYHRARRAVDALRFVLEPVTSR